MSDDVELRISPEPSEEDREAVLTAVREALRREAELARPPGWRIAGWVAQRIGISDVADWVPSPSRWRLSSRMPRGGRIFPGLNGRGDAK